MDENSSDYVRSVKKYNGIVISVIFNLLATGATSGVTQRAYRCSPKIIFVPPPKIII